jgi:hypothetical protein
VHLTNFVIDSSVKKNALSCGGFASVDMRHDPDVTDLGEVDCSIYSHVLSAPYYQR